MSMTQRHFERPYNCGYSRRNECRCFQRTKIVKESEIHFGGMAKCKSCDCTKNLWICLQCGHSGCGRANNSHALQHYHDTGHSCCMNLGTVEPIMHDPDQYTSVLQSRRFPPQISCLIFDYIQQLSARAKGDMWCYDCNSVLKRKMYSGISLGDRLAKFGINFLALNKSEMTVEEVRKAFPNVTWVVDALGRVIHVEGPEEQVQEYLLIMNGKDVNKAKS